MRVIAVSGGLRFRFGTTGIELGKGSRLRRNWSDSQSGRSKAAPTVGLSKIRCCNDQIIFQIICVYLYYRKRRDGSKKKSG
jgi:hypothetical protein